MLKFINEAEYIIFGLFFSLKEDTDMPKLETEEEAKQKKKRTGIKNNDTKTNDY